MNKIVTGVMSLAVMLIAIMGFMLLDTPTAEAHQILFPWHLIERTDRYDIHITPVSNGWLMKVQHKPLKSHKPTCSFILDPEHEWEIELHTQEHPV